MLEAGSLDRERDIRISPIASCAQWVWNIISLDDEMAAFSKMDD